MASGKVKWWDNRKGFGFISQDTGQDVFVHHTEILGGGFKVLNEGDEVTFDIIASEKSAASYFPSTASAPAARSECQTKRSRKSRQRTAT